MCDITHNSLFFIMAATTNSDEQICSVCFDPTKYICISCKEPVCNICSIFEENEEKSGWKAGKSVGYCVTCLHETDGSANNSSHFEVDHGSASNLKRIKKRNRPLIETEILDEDTDSRCSGNAEDVDNENEEDGDESLSKETGNKKTKHKKPGRKSRWSADATDDFIDIVINNDQFKTKLIFQNTKNQQNRMLYDNILSELKKRGTERGEEITFSPEQLRTKFKKCVGECKKAALTIKTATGIKRFQEEKNYGSWFTQLFAVVKTRDSCQPEQAIEPSANSTTVVRSEGSDNDGEQLFVPVKRSRKSNRQDSTADAVKVVRQVLDDNRTNNMIDCMREEMEKSREHETRLFQMMFQAFMPVPPAQQPLPQGYAYPNIPVTQNVLSSSSLHNNFAQHHSSGTSLNQGSQSNLHVLRPVSPSAYQPYQSFSAPVSSGQSSTPSAYQPYQSFSAPVSSGQSSTSNSRSW